MKSIVKSVLAMTVLAMAAGRALAGAPEDVAATAAAFFKAQNAHDIKTVSSIMMDTKDFLLIRGPVLVWGHDAAVKQYEDLYKGVWSVKPGAKAPKVVMLNENTAQTFIPVTFTVGPKEGDTKQFTLNVTQIWVQSGKDWKIHSILATPVKPN